MTSSTEAERRDNDYDADDPFAPNPEGISWKEIGMGNPVHGTITGKTELIQQLDFKTKKPEFWEAGSPKMVAVFPMELDDGEVVSVWARKPSSLFNAIRTASKEAGASVRVGGSIEIEWYAEEPPKKKGDDPQKLFRVSYVPPR